MILESCTPIPSKIVEAEAAAAAVASPDPKNYLLGPEDMIEVAVWKEPDLTKQLVVRPDGKISYPLIGEIHAAGLTVKQLQGEILKRLEKFVTNANVTVILMKTQYYKVYVTGLVNKPGEFLVGRPITALQAIAMAGGLTPFAAPRRIVILRKEESFSFDYKAVAGGESLERNRVLMPGDVVVVP